MSGPQIPYIKLPDAPLGLPIHPFGVLVATGVYVGAYVATRRAKQRHLDEAAMSAFILYVVGMGFIGGHVFDAIFYTPERIAKSPIYLLEFWAGLSSYGGFMGAIAGLAVFKYVKKVSVIAYADTVCSAFPIAWVFGRAGCASVHDHPGRDTASWLGIQAYNPRVKDAHTWGLIYDPGQVLGRFDLGFLEFVLTIPLALAFIVLWRKRPRAFGFFAGWMCIVYAPVRFALDFLRIQPDAMHDGDPRYGGLTPAQWACFGLVALGFAILRFSKRHPAPPTWEALEAIRPPPEKSPASAMPPRGADDLARARRRRRVKSAKST